MMANDNLRFKQIAVGQWDGGSGLTYNIIGLSEDGKVYKHTRYGWQNMGAVAVPAQVEQPLSVSTTSHDDPF
jgi:hypothetical protein